MILVWSIILLSGASVSGQSQCQEDLLFNVYLGNVSRTNLGRTCQAWSSQTPFRHAYTKDDMFADGSVELAHNYCRKTERTPLPWCYTTDIDHGWDFCDWMICQPPSQPCGGLLTEASGQIASPDLDQDGIYENWIECFWDIRVEDSKIIEITIVSLIIEFDFDGCLTDYLEAWEPHARLFKLCYINIEGIVFNTQYNILAVHFFADESDGLNGFVLVYSQREAPSCGGEVKGESGEFRPSLDVNGHYEANLSCSWFIRVSYFHVIHLLITNLDIDYSSPCEGDYLQVFQFSIEKIGEFEFKQVVDKTCAQSGKIDITSQTELQVTFATDNVGNERTGFIAYFNQTLEIGECWQGLAPKQYGGNIHVSDRGRICQSWSSQSPHEHGFTAINFPIDGSVADSLNYCRNAMGKGRPFCLTVDPEIGVDNCANRICAGNPDCLNGHVTMAYNGNVSTTNHGFTCQAWASKSPNDHSLTDSSHYEHDGYSITRASNYCRALAGDIRPWCFTTNPDVQWDYCHIRICRGYDQTCGGTLTKQSGVITSPDDDNDNQYDSYSLCMWTIQSGPNSLTEISFIFINIHDVDPCELDYVMIFANEKEMAAFCGRVIPEPIVTTSITTTIKFVSQTETGPQQFTAIEDTNAIDTTGFKISYKIERFGEDDESGSSTTTTRARPPTSTPTDDQTTNREGQKSTTTSGDPHQSTESASKTEPPTSSSDPSFSTTTSSAKSVVSTTETHEPLSKSSKTPEASEYSTATTEEPTSLTTLRQPTPTIYTLRGSTGAKKSTWNAVMSTWKTVGTRLFDFGRTETASTSAKPSTVTSQSPTTTASSGTRIKFLNSRCLLISIEILKLLMVEIGFVSFL